MRTQITFPKPCNKKRCLQSKGSHRQTLQYKLWKTYLMVKTITFYTKVFKNHLAKSRLSQNYQNRTHQIKVSFSLLRDKNLKNLTIQKLHTHISRQFTMKQLIPLSIRFGTGLRNLDSKCSVRLSSYS